MNKLLYRLFLLATLVVVFSSCKDDSKMITSFGYMNEKLEESTSVTKVKNDFYKGILERNVKEDSLRYMPIYKRLTNAEKASNEFFYYLESVKDSIYDGTLGEDEARSSFEKLTSSDFLDEYFFDVK